MVTIWDCSYYNLAKVDSNLHNVINQSHLGFYKTHKGCVTPTQILTSVKSKLFYGFIKNDLHVNEQEISKKGVI